MKQYVQHVSGVGEKWEVEEPYGETQWKVIRSIPKGIRSIGMSFHYLPTSEYHLCEPPEKWVDVEVQIVEHPHIKDARDPGGIYDGAKKLAQLQCGGAYRIKTLIVEKKVIE